MRTTPRAWAVPANSPSMIQEVRASRNQPPVSWNKTSQKLIMRKGEDGKWIKVRKAKRDMTAGANDV